MTVEEDVISWTKENFPVGKKLGYPECCILHFCIASPERLKQFPPDHTAMKIRYEAAHIDGKYTGSLPGSCAADPKRIHTPTGSHYTTGSTNTCLS